MIISPIQEEILEKLYIKAYVTEKTDERKSKYIEFINENFGSNANDELLNEILNSFLNYWILGFLFLVLFFGNIDMFFSVSDDNAKLLAYIMLCACGISLIAGFYFNRKKIKILKWLKPFQIAKSLELSNDKKETLKKHEEYRAQKAKELREKYL